MQKAGRIVYRIGLGPCGCQRPYNAPKTVLPPFKRRFHASPARKVVKPFILADIGEGIKEVQIIQWFVKPGARVEQFDKLCEVASDKAIVEITSRFDGVIKELHHEPDAMAQVGKPLCDIDIQSDISAADEALLKPTSEVEGKAESTQDLEGKRGGAAGQSSDPQNSQAPTGSTVIDSEKDKAKDSAQASKLATPAVRGLLKELNVNIENIQGTGKDGRVLKEDVHRHVASGSLNSQGQTSAIQQEKQVPLTSVQAIMFKTMTQSLSVPHFLFTDDVDLTALDALRARLNAFSSFTSPKLTYLPFILKAVSLSLQSFPLLNACLSTSSGAAPNLTYRHHHNIGVAIDAPSGLLVPNIKDVAAHTVSSIATALADLSSRARAGRLDPADLSGGTISVSNIGALGGGSYVAPILLPGELAILGIGRARDVPAFDEKGNVVKKKVAAFCWSADHRIVDGATMARMAGRVKELVEEPGRMIVELR